MMKLSFIFIIVVLCSFLHVVQCKQIVLGIIPERASYYDLSKPFSCLDGSGVIPASQINDDYCDCRDGSDEPGTSACINGVFACENIGHVVQLIPSSRINDNICDCCDGSDEYKSDTKCENTCDVLAVESRREEERIRKVREEGFQKRKELIEEGTKLKEQFKKEIEDLNSKKNELNEERDKLEEKKIQSESLSNQAKGAEDLIFEEKVKEFKKVENEKKAKILFDLLDLDKDSYIIPEELMAKQELKILFDSDGPFTYEQAKELLDGNDKVAFDIFLSTYYDKIASHLKSDEDNNSNDDNSEQTQEEINDNDEEQEDADYEDENNNDPPELLNHDQQNEQSGGEEELKKPDYTTETQRLIDEYQADKTKLDEADKEIRDIDRSIDSLTQKINQESGPNNEFLSFFDKCFEYDDKREYIYKLCPFDRTVQKSKNNNAETVIGHWSRWSDKYQQDSDDIMSRYEMMHFNEGLACWNGPKRSTNVYLYCGIENQIVSVSEPNRCEYEMKFETPAVCSEFNKNQDTDIHEDL